MPGEQHLYDYITAMELGSATTTTNEDLYTQLAQKEQDLLLAAQLGKALLEKNEELSMQNEKMAEDYSKQLEVIVSHFHIFYTVF